MSYKIVFFHILFIILYFVAMEMIAYEYWNDQKISFRLMVTRTNEQSITYGDG